MKHSIALPQSIFLSQGVLSEKPNQELIFRQGEPVKGVFFIVNGKVKISRESLNGKTFILWYAGKNELIGLTSFFNATSTYSFSASIESDSASVLFIERNQFKSLLTQEKSLKKAIISMLCYRIKKIENQTQEIALTTSKERLAKTLVAMVKQQYPESKQHKVFELIYKNEDLASKVGVKPSYLEKLFVELKELNILYRKHHIMIIQDFKTLLNVAFGHSVSL